MKKVLFLVLAYLFLGTSMQFTYGQIQTKVTWTSQVSPKYWEKGDTVKLIMTGDIDKNWFVYSSDFDPECGPIVATITSDNKTFTTNTPLISTDVQTIMDDIFECEVGKLYPKAIFKQSFIAQENNGILVATLSYQACSTIDGQCINYQETFTHQAAAKKDSHVGVSKTKNKQDHFSSISDTENSKENILTTSRNNISSVEPIKKESAVNKEEGINEESADKQEINDQVIDKQKSSEENKSYPTKKMKSFFDDGFKHTKPTMWAFILAAFISGLISLFTPCVFPMIPMTVSFFTTEGNKGKAFVYGLSIIIIYTFLGVIIAPLMGPDTANHLATGWFLNIIFFLVFLFFAMAFFGMFELVLPSKLVNSVDEQSEKSGFIGVFFMAFTLVLVSFSCTGPIVGTLLVQSAGGEVLKPIVGMATFGLAFALPFTLFALFPKLMNKLPKSGGWLNSVKVVLGFIELALAFKFLSIPDQAYHWGILDREVNIAIWIVIFTLMGFYLLGKIKLPHDSPLDHISVPRLMLAICTFTFVVYLIPGLVGHPLKALAGYLPPMHTHDYNLLKEIRKYDEEADISTLAPDCVSPSYQSFLHLPHGISGYFDYKEALACAKATNKPLFIDFTGHGCTNCREMEAVVWSDEKVLSRLKNDYIVLALYVDDKTELPEKDWYISPIDDRLKKTIGRQNADLQIQKAQSNAQPNYILLGANEKALVDPKARDTDIDAFVAFLDEGLKKFKE